MLELARAAVAEHGPIEAAGVGAPGVLDYAHGRAAFLPNLPGPWAATPLVDPIAAGLGVRVSLINDARAFTLGELRLGAGQGCDNLLCVGLGTGVGGGVAVNGRLHIGVDGTAGEFGHQTVELDGRACGCGNRGCIETYASGPAIARDGGQSTPELVAEAAKAGDDRALATFEQAGRYLGVAIANAVVLLAPQRVVIGGGVAAAGDLLLDPIRSEVERRVHVVPTEQIGISLAALGSYAGAIGAALWGLEAPR
jgi:glucokinase